MSIYRKKPVIIEAFMLNERGLVAEDWFWDAVTKNDIITHSFGKHYPDPAWCEIKTLEGVMVAKTGDYIIRGVNGEIYPCKADIFDKTYEVVDKPKTNADRIRGMSDEELAKFIVGNADGEEYQTYEYEFSIENVRYFSVGYEHQGETAEDSVLYWLKQPAEE